MAEGRHASGSVKPRRRGRENFLATPPWQCGYAGVAAISHGAVAGCRHAGVAAISHGAVAEKVYLPRRRGRVLQRRLGSDLPRRRGRCSLCWSSSVACSDINSLRVKFLDKICKTNEQPLLDSRIHI